MSIGSNTRPEPGGRHVTRRPLVGGATLVIGLLGLVACEPPPPPAELVVTSTAIGADALPGDGVCEATAGAGDCTLQAAVDEGNALGHAAIGLPAGSYPGSPSLSVTGALSIRKVGSGNASMNHWVTVEEGAQPRARRDLVVQRAGRSLLRQGVAGGASPQPHRAGELGSGGGGAHRLRGARELAPGPRVRGQGDHPEPGHGGPAQHSAAVVDLRRGHHAGAVQLRAGHRGREHPAEPCTGVDPESLGHNSDDDGSCGLTGPGDQPGAPADVTISVSGVASYGAEPGLAADRRHPGGHARLRHRGAG